MAGILANSPTQTMVSGDTAADKTVTGYLTGEEIALSTTGTVSSFSWGQALPSGSAQARSGLNSSTVAAPKFTPDVAGYYLITCNADGTNYVIRIQVLETATSTVRSALILQHLDNSQVATPQVGSIAVYAGSDNTIRFKDSDGTVHTVTDT